MVLFLFCRSRSRTDIQNAPVLVPEDLSFVPPAQMFEQFPSQTEWTQDLGQLLLGGGSISVSPPPPFISEVHELLATLPSPTLPATFPSPVLPPGLAGTEPTPTPAQEIVLSLPSPASLNALAEHFFDDSEHRACTPTVPSAPSLLGSGYATAEGSPDLGVEPYLPPDVAFGSTALFDWTTLAGAILPPHAEPSLITDHDGEGVPDQTERSESFELVSPHSISAVNDNGERNDHADAHAWWTDFAGLAPRFSVPQPDPRCTLELEEDQGQEQEQRLVVDLSGATPPQVQIDMVKAHAEMVSQLVEEIQVQITGQAPEVPLDPVQPEYVVRIEPSKAGPTEPNLEPSLPPSPPVVPQDLSPVASQRLSSLSPPFQHSSHQHAVNKCPYVSLPIKGRERKRKAVVINEDTVNGVDGDSHGDAKVAQKRPVKRRKSETADAKPRTRKKKGVRVGETTKVTSSDDPIRERMIVTTDEKGELKMIPLRTRAKQHDHQVDLSANANPQPPQAQLLLSQVEVPSPPPRPPQAKPMVPRRILPHPDTSHPLVSSASQPLAGRIQNASNTLLEPRVPTVPAVPVVSTSVLQHGTPRSLLANPHPPSHSLSARAPAPCPTSPVGSIVAPLPRYAASYNHVESWNGGFTDMELESEAQLLSALPPPIRRYPAQSYTFGTGIVDIHGQIDVGQGASTQAQYQQQATPVYAECSFARNSTRVSVPAQAYRHYQHNPASAPAPALASASASASAPAPLSYTHAEIPQCRYYPLGAQQQIQPAVRQTQRMGHSQHIQALQDSLMYAVPSIERYQHQPSFHTHDTYQAHLHPAPYSYQHPDANDYEQMPVESLYPSQYAHSPYISGYHYPYV